MYNPKVYRMLKTLEDTREKITVIDLMPIDKLTPAVFKRLDALHKRNLEAWEYLSDCAQGGSGKTHAQRGRATRKSSKSSGSIG